MAIRDSNYEGRFLIPTPKGIYQAGGDTNISTDYAYRAENIRTELGLLASGHGTSDAMPAVGRPIGTLERFYRRNRPDDPEVFVAAAGDALYTYTAGAEGWVKRGEGYHSDKWSCVTYEAVEDGETVDILLMTNAQDGMHCIFGSDLRVEKIDLAIGDYQDDEKTYENVNFAVLGRYAERIWGTGAPGYPDSIFYSRPYNPLDWTGNEQLPEMGGGVINQPTWDGESFIALSRFGSYMVAIKPSTVFEIRGTDPSSFSISEAYGTDGPIEASSIGIDRTSMYYLAENGIGLYDGSTTRILGKNALYEIMRELDREHTGLVTACVCNHVYYIALPIGEHQDENNAVIELDTERGTFMLRTGINVRDFYALGGTVYCTQSGAPYGIYKYNDEDARGWNGANMKSVWETPWLDLGKGYVKSNFTLRFTAEAEEDDYPLTITVITEKREKVKNVVLHSDRRDYKVHIQTHGKRVKLRLEASSRAAGFAIHGGVQIEYEIEEE